MLHILCTAPALYCQSDADGHVEGMCKDVFIEHSCALGYIYAGLYT